MAGIPSYLEVPASSAPLPPPVSTRAQDLTLEKLTGENFERLCLRLARLEADVVHCQQYGTEGQLNTKSRSE